MKKLFLTLTFFIAFIMTTLACNITFTLLDSKGNTVNPQKVKTGETYTVVVVYKNTHGNCEIPIKDTKFKTDGVKVVSATDWKAENGGYVRKLKIEITDNKKSEVFIQALRTCDRGGADLKLVLKR
ncbi:MAG TPA: hypothetical protein PKG88_01805 [Bacteroidales bacterium]|jgi:hypothetical protein|nr:hypothetical protein [Bacteroidales bacterium]HPS71446.1 hypothetical protein [Bacteroidales bacterium]